MIVSGFRRSGHILAVTRDHIGIISLRGYRSIRVSQFNFQAKCANLMSTSQELQPAFCPLLLPTFYATNLPLILSVTKIRITVQPNTFNDTIDLSISM